MRSDLAKADARDAKATNYAEIPELGNEFFEQADEHRAGVLVKRGLGRSPRS